MSTPPPQPPPSGGGPHPLPERPNTLLLVLKVVGVLVGAVVLLVVVGIGLIALTCSGILR